MKRLATISLCVGLYGVGCAAEKPKADNSPSEAAKKPESKTSNPAANENSARGADSTPTGKTETPNVATTGLPFETITFPSADGLEITADLYLKHPKASPMIVAFHQAGWSRGEYLEIAPRLNKAGFNVMAVDARSGGGVNGVKNETAERAKKAGKKTTYTEAASRLGCGSQAGAGQVRNRQSHLVGEFVFIGAGHLPGGH